MKLRSVMTVLALTGALPCFAGTGANVVVTDFKKGSQTATIINNNIAIGTYPAGEFIGFLDGNPFSTFCTDVYQSFGWNNLNNPYTYELKTVGETKTLWSTGRYTPGSYSQVSKLFTAHYTNEFKDSVSSASAAQTLANGWLGSLAGMPEGYSIQSLYSGASQKPGNQRDFMVATPVPEPAAYALALVSLGIVAGYARRKRDKA